MATVTVVQGAKKSSYATAPQHTAEQHTWKYIREITDPYTFLI